MSTIPTMKTLKDRLHKIELKKASGGVSIDPSWTIESENIQKAIGQMDLIDTYRERLKVLIDQRANLGVHAPPTVITSIEECRTNIANLRRVCSDLGYYVDTYPGDVEEINLKPHSSTSTVSPLDTVKESLRDIETMIRLRMYDHALNLIKELQDTIR